MGETKGILDQLGIDTIQEVLREYSEGTHCQISCRDTGDPGPEIEVGQDRRVALEDLGPLERLILPDNNFLLVHFLEEGAAVQRAVARVTLTESHGRLPAGTGWGTGFLVSPSLFMTNNHVIRDKAFTRKVEMQFNFQLDYNGNALSVDAYSADPDDVFYTNVALDFTLVRLNPRCRWIIGNSLRFRNGDRSWGDGIDNPVNLVGYTPDPLGPVPPLPVLPAIRVPFVPSRDGLPWARHCENPGEAWGYLRLSDSLSYATDQHLNIVQHPKGRRKEVALQQNNLTNVYAGRIRYTTDTEPGSSGSAVFNNAWELVAIHHAAGEWDEANNRWLSNEGMRIDKIVEDLRDRYSGTTTGSQILAELGI